MNKKEKSRSEQFEINTTPRAVVEQALRFLKTEYESVIDVPSYLDPGAGSGVYCKVVRELWPNAVITAVEPREEEADALRAVADEVIVGPFEPTKMSGRKWNLIAGNPPFSQTRAWVREIVKENMCRTLMLLEKVQAFQRGLEGLALIREFPPAAELRVAQALQFRPDKGSDSICYSHWVWRVNEVSPLACPRWDTYQLPNLSSRDRR